MGTEDSEKAEDTGTRWKQEPLNWPVAVSVAFFGIQTIAQLAVSAKLLIQVWPAGSWGTLLSSVTNSGICAPDLNK